MTRFPAPVYELILETLWILWLPEMWFSYHRSWSCEPTDLIAIWGGPKNCRYLQSTVDPHWNSWTQLDWIIQPVLIDCQKTDWTDLTQLNSLEQWLIEQLKSVGYNPLITNSPVTVVVFPYGSQGHQSHQTEFFYCPQVHSRNLSQTPSEYGSMDHIFYQWGYKML